VAWLALVEEVEAADGAEPQQLIRRLLAKAASLAGGASLSSYRPS
jgi:hypothetical protein